MKNDKWFKEILSQIKFGKGFPVAKFYFHPLYRVGVGKDSNLDYIFGRQRRAPLKNLRKFSYFSFEAPLPLDSVIFFQPERERLIVASKAEGKVLKISIKPGQLALLSDEVDELRFQNSSLFSPHSVKYIEHGGNWLLTEFCSNLDSVKDTSILELKELLKEPLVKFHKSRRIDEIPLRTYLEQLITRGEGHPQLSLLSEALKKFEDTILLKGKIHFDLHQGNVLREGSKLVIIDWELSRDGLLLIDFFDFYRRYLMQKKISSSRIVDELRKLKFKEDFQEWVAKISDNSQNSSEEFYLKLYCVERTLQYWERWKENRFEDKKGLEYQVLVAK